MPNDALASMTNAQRIEFAQLLALRICEGHTVDHGLDVALAMVWIAGRAVHGTSEAARGDAAFMGAHDAIVAVRRRVREASGGNTFIMQSQLPPDPTLTNAQAFALGELHGRARGLREAGASAMSACIGVVKAYAQHWLGANRAKTDVAYEILSHLEQLKAKADDGT